MRSNLRRLAGPQTRPHSRRPLPPTRCSNWRHSGASWERRASPEKTHSSWKIHSTPCAADQKWSASSRDRRRPRPRCWCPPDCWKPAKRKTTRRPPCGMRISISARYSCPDRSARRPPVTGRAAAVCCRPTSTCSSPDSRRHPRLPNWGWDWA